MDKLKDRAHYLQHKVRREVKDWIEQEAKAQERSQTWVINKLVEDAFARAKPAGTAGLNNSQGAQA